MNRIYFILICLSSALCWTGCENTYLDLETKEELVVEGWIENGHSPVVFVSKTLPASSTPRKLDDLSDIVLRYAKVYIDHAGVRTYLTARLSDKYMLQNYFTTNDIKGEVGHSYTLHVEWEDFKASATCTIPEPCPIDTAYIVSKKDCDTLFFARMEFDNSPVEKTWYQYFVRAGAADTTAFHPMHYGKMASDAITRGPVVVDVYNNKSKDLYFHPGEKLAVKLATMEEPMADFWEKLSDASFLSGNVVTPMNINCKGNVAGALGYWAGYGISVRELQVRDVPSNRNFRPSGN